MNHIAFKNKQGIGDRVKSKNAISYSLNPALYTLRRGFTLVEMIVSIAIFAIVAVVALAALVKIIDANKRAQSIQNAVTDMSFGLDSMSRELRSGSAYYCGSASDTGDLNSYVSGPATNIASSPCNSGISDSANGAVIAFVSSRTASNGSGGTCSLVTAYEITGTAYDWMLGKAEQTACNGALPAFSPVIDSSSVSLTGYYVQVAEPTGGDFPLAFVQLTGSAGTKQTTTTYFTVQTAASPRAP